jgi:predicted nucleic acid-binding protein
VQGTNGTSPESTASLIAATALDAGLTLVTRNRKHFEIIDGIRLQIPPYQV